ncbi:MAG: oligosaccharide flippase family protein, partial [bacterium]
MNSLKQQTLKSVRWTSFHAIVRGAMGPLTLIFKSRFLNPEEFAYLSIILIVIGLFRLLENFGISQAIIQKDVISKEANSTIFLFNIVFNTFLALIVFFNAGFIDQFYSMPKLEYYLQLVSIIVLINGPSLLFRAHLEKELHFKQLAIIDIIVSIINFIVLILLLYFNYGVLAVVYSSILSTFFTSMSIIIYSNIIIPIKLNFYFRFSILRSFLRFGAFVSGKQLLTFTAERLDELVIGYFLTPEI